MPPSTTICTSPTIIQTQLPLSDPLPLSLQNHESTDTHQIMPFFPPLTRYTANLLRLRNLLLACIKALRRVRPGFLALLTSYNPANPAPEQLLPLLDYVELRFAIGYYFRTWWAWRLGPVVLVVWGTWWTERLRESWWVAGLLCAVVGLWVMGNK